MRNLLRVSTIFLFFLGSYSGFSQDDVYIFGVVREAEFRKKVSGVEITVYKDGNKYNTVNTNSSGKYELILNFEHNYKVVYSYPGLVSKFLTFNLKDIPDVSKEGGSEISIDMELFKEIEGLDVSILDNPIGKFEYNPSTMEVNYNKEYTSQMKAQLAALMREYDRKSKEEADRREKMEQDFKNLVQKGDDAVRNKKYSDGVDFYADALVLKPDDENVKEKKRNAELEVAELLALKGKEDKYNTFINTGDKYFADQEWENALSSFESAAEIFPTESYPKTRITAINQKLDDIRNNAEKEATVAKLIKEGDALVAKDEFDSGIAKYNDCLALIAGHKLTLEQIKIANEKKKVWMLAQEKDQNYANLIADADTEFDANKFRESITIYKEALKLKSNESYPKEQINKAEGVIAKAGAEREKRNEFNKLVSAGDGKVNAKAYEDGINKYNEALVLYPDDDEVLNKIKLAEASLASVLAAGEIDKRYLAAIAAGDKSLGNKEYDAAKSSYNQALAIKENSDYPQRKLDEIEGILSGLAASELAMAKRERQQQFDKLVREGDENAINAAYNDAITSYEEALIIIEGDAVVLEKIENAKRKRQALSASEELDEQFAELISRADREFDTESYESAKNTYKAALEIRTDSYPKKRIAEIDLLLLELASRMDDEKKMDAFLALEKEGDGLVSEEDYLGGISSYESALAMIPDEKRVIDKKTKAEKKLAELSASTAIDEQYAGYISKADAAFSERSYRASRKLYQKAFTTKADDYPKNKIKEIDRLILSNERKAAEEEAAKLAGGNTNHEWNDNSSDVDRYIEEAEQNRKNSQNDKYAELLAYKMSVKTTNQEYNQKGETLRNNNYSKIVAERQGTESNLDKGDRLNKSNLNKSNDDIQSYENWMKQRSNEQEQASKDYYAEVVDQRNEYNRVYSAKSEVYMQYSREVQAEKEAQQNEVYTKSQEHQRKIKDNYYQSRELAAEQFRIFSGDNSSYEDNLKDVAYEKEDKVLNEKKYKRKQDSQIQNGIIESKGIEDSMNKMGEDDSRETQEAYDKLSSENEMRELEADRWKNNADLKREQANDEVRGGDYSGEKSYDNYSSGTKANQYQQGVTEETYTEGNNQIVKRVIVRGNKVDEYKMVVTKSGTYYFLNGTSITKNTWTRETSKKNPDLD